MPRKSARENGGFRRTGWKAKLAKREAEEKRIVKNIYIGASNAKRWIILKKKLEYRSDVDFVAYLLNLAEPFSGKGKLERKDQEDSDGKKIPISKVPAISVDEEDNTDRSQKSRGDDVDCNGSVDDSGEVSKGGDFEATDVVEGGEGDEEEDEVEEDEDDGGATVAARRGGGGSNRVERGGKEDAESEREVVEEEEEGEEEEEDEEEENGGGEWTECRQPLRRSLRSIPTKESAKQQLSVRRSARNVHRGGEEEGEEALDEEGEEVEGEEVRRGGGEEGTEGRGEGDGEEEETVTVKKKKRGDRSERRQRRRERKKRRKRKRLEGSSEGEVEGGDGADEPEEEGEESEGGEEEVAAGVERGAKGAEESEVDGAQEGGSGVGEPPVPAPIISEKHVEVEPVDAVPAVIEVEPPRKGKRGRKKKVVTLDVAAVAETVSVELDGVVEKEKGEAGEENREEEPLRDCPSPIHPQDVIPEEVVRDDDSATTHHTDSVEEPAVAVTEGGESDRVSKHHRHHKRKSRKSRDSLEDEGEGGDDGGEGEDVGGDGWEGGEGRKRRRKKRGRQKRSIEECPPTLTAVTAVDVEEGDFAAEAVEEEENFPRYEVVEGVLGDAEALGHQEKAQGGTATQPGSEGTNVDGATSAGGVVQEEEEEGVLIEVGERVKLKRRRKRRHSRGGEEGEGDGEGGNGGDTSCEDHLGSLRRAAKHKKRKHGHGEGHSNRRKHHDVRKVPVDGVLPEQPPAPSTPLPNVENLPPEPSEDSLHESQANAASVSSLPTSTSMQPQSSLPAGANPATGASGAAGKAPADTKQRVAIRITLCGECDSRHVLDACPLKRPLTIIHDTVVLRETTADEESKDDDPGADGIPFGDNETKNFANEEEEEGEADDRQDAQDVACKKKKKKSTGDDEDALISAGGKEQDDRRRRRNGFSEALEDRLSVPNGKYQQTSGDRSQLVVVAAQDEVKQVNGDNSDGSVTDGKEDTKEESSLEIGNNKLDAHEEDMLSNGDANLAPNSSLSPKPLVVNELESATETLASQPSPIPMPDPISASDTTVGGGNNSSGKSFAEASLPMALKLETREASHGPGVTAKRPIARFTQFGPLLGRKIREMDIPDDFGMRHIWEVMGASGRFLLSTEDPTSSNWLRFIRPAPTREQRNVAPVTRGDRLYFVTTAPLQVGEELLYWPDESSGTNAVATSGAAASSTPNSSSNPSSTSSSSSSASSSSGTGWAKKKMEKTNCGGCNLRFGHPLYYRLHCSVFHDPNFSLTIRKYHCKVCGAAVLGKENIMRHAAENHDGKGAYQCQFCKKFFLRLNYLEMHRTYGCAANPQRTRPLCDFCGRKFCQPQKLKVHIKRMHSDMADVLREFQCKLCLKLLGSRAALQRHMKEVHHRDVVGACACDRCGKTFQNKSNLKIHMLTHSGVKPFRCAEDNCPAAFTTKQCLQFHYKKVHGYAEDNMPSIERCVAYTFDAYSGGTVEDPGRGKVPLFAGTRLGKDADDMDSNQSTQALGSELGDDECVGAEGESPQQQPRVRKEASGEGKREKGGRGRGRRPGRPSGSGRVAMGVPSVTPETATPDSTAATLLHEENSGGGMHVKGIVEGDALVVVDSMVPPTIIPEDILPHHQDADVLPPPPPVIPSLPDGSVDCKEDIGSRERTFIGPSLYSRYPVPAMLGSMVDSQPPPLTPQPGPLPTEVAPQTPTLEAYNGGQAVLGPPTTMAQYTDHARVSFPGGKVVSKGSKKWMGDGSVPMRPSSEMDEEEDEEEEEEEDEEEEELEEDVGAKRAEEEEGEVVGVVHADGQVVADVYGAFPEDGRFADEAGPEEGFRRPEESNASLLVEAALDAAERDMTGGGGGVAEDEPKHPSEPNTDGYQLAPSPARTNGPDQQRPHLGDEGDHRVLHHPQASHHHALQQHHSHHPPSHHHLQHHPHHLSLHPQLAHPHVHLPPPASHLHVQGGALMLHHSHHPHHHGAASSSIHSHHPSAHHAGGAGLHPDDDEDDDRLGPGSEANSVGTIVERIVNTSLAEDDETDGRDEVVVPHPSVRAMHHLLHPDTYAPEPHGRLPPAGSLPSPRNMTLLGMKAAVKVEEELQHMAALQQQRTEEDEEGEEEGLDMSYKHAAAVGHYGRAAGLAAHHMQQDEDEEGNQGVGPGDPSADELQDFRVLRSPQVVEGRFEQSSGGLDMSRGSFTFALPSAAAARCFPLYEGSGSAADVARSVDLRRAGLAYTSPPLPPYSQSLDLTPMRTRHSVDLSLPRSLVGSDGVGGPQQGSGGQSPPSPMHRHLCHAPPPVSPHHHVHHHPHGGGVDGIGGCIVGDDGGEGASSGGLSPPPPGSYQSAGGYLHGPPSYHRQGLVQHPPSPPPSPYHPQARTAPHMPPPPPAASPSPYHHYSGYY